MATTRYVKSSGVSLAYRIHGEGEPTLLCVPGALAHLALDEAIPPEFWGGTDRYFTDQVGTKAGYARFWEETAIGFDEPFRSYAAERLERNPRRSAHP